MRRASQLIVGVRPIAAGPGTWTSSAERLVVWDAIETAIDILDFVLHWRFYVCLLGGLALGIVADAVVQDPNRGLAAPIVGGVCGLVVGIVWEWKS